MKQVFISYSHKDQAWRDRLFQHLEVLQQNSIVSVLPDSRINAGDSWLPEIDKLLEVADVAILLISANFLASPFIKEFEIPRILERSEKKHCRFFH